MSRTLVIYYSRRGQNYVNGKIEDLKKGNTQRIAEFIQQAVGADLFEVKTRKAYAADYTACTIEAKEELQNQEFPELVNQLDSLEGYESIVVAGPCWWGTYPMAICTQLKALDFHGRKVFPVMTHEGSGLGSSVRTLRQYCPGAVIGEGLAIHGAEAGQAGAQVQAWAVRNLL